MGQSTNTPNSHVSGTITWDWKARHLLKDKFVRKDMVKLVLFSGGGVTLLLLATLFFMGELEEPWPILRFCGVITAGLVALFLLIMLVIGGSLRYRFTVDPKGVGFEVLSKGVKKTNWLSIAVGVLAGNPGVTGAGMLAKAEEHNRIDFQDLTRFRLYPGDQVIVIRGRYNPKPIRLYCPPEQYAEIAQRIQRGFAAGRKLRQEEEQVLGPSPLPRRLRWSAFALIASAIFLASPIELPPLAVIATGLAALAAIWVTHFKRFLGSLCALLPIAVLAFLVYEGTRLRFSMKEEEVLEYAKSQGVELQSIHESALGPYTLFNRLDPDEWFALCLCVLGCALLIWTGVKALRGGFARKGKTVPR